MDETCINGVEGREFGFIVFYSEDRLYVPLLKLNKFLIIVVVLSMAPIPLISEVGGTSAYSIGEIWKLTVKSMPQ